MNGLAAAAIDDTKIDLDVVGFLLLQSKLLQVLGYGGDEGVILLIERDTHPDGGRRLLSAAGSESCQQDEKGEQRESQFHGTSFRGLDHRE